MLYLANRNEITTVVEQTELRDVIARRFGGGTGADTPDTSGTGRSVEDNAADEPGATEPGIRFTDPLPQDGPPATEPAPRPAPQTSGSSQTTPQPEPSTSPRPNTVSEPQSSPPPAPSPNPAPNPAVQEVAVTEPVTRTRTSRLYYIRVNDTGLIEPIPVEREVSYVDAPLSATISALISGPTRDELSSGLLNLLPEDVSLLGAWVRDGVAFLNFNESFRFNPLGVEGLLAQLQQIVFSATEFSTVERVQILIDGESIDYLSGDGIFVGRPIARSDFYAGGG